MKPCEQKLKNSDAPLVHLVILAEFTPSLCPQSLSHMNDDPEINHSPQRCNGCAGQ